MGCLALVTLWFDLGRLAYWFGLRSGSLLLIAFLWFSYVFVLVKVFVFVCGCFDYTLLRFLLRTGCCVCFTLDMFVVRVVLAVVLVFARGWHCIGVVADLLVVSFVWLCFVLFACFGCLF